MFFRVFVVSQLLAIANMAYLSYTHYHLKFGLGGGKSFCNISEAFNCDVVNLSPYATLLGIPVSLLGFLAHILVLGLGLFSQIEINEEKKRHLQNLTFLGMVVMVLISLVFAGISFAFLNTYCLFCLLAYLLAFVSLGSLIKWRSDLQGSLMQDRGVLSSTLGFLFDFQRGFKFLLAILLLLPLGALSHEIIKSNLAGDHLRRLDTLILDWQETPPHTFQTDTALVHSPKQPVKMTILEFADFQCPYCKMTSQTLHTFISSRDDVELIFMAFPLDGSCNPAISRAGDGRSCLLASATYCAQQQGKGWQMHDQLFEQFHEVSKSNLNEITEQIGVDFSMFSECLEAERTLDVIRSQAQQGERANITGTPALFVNGKRLPSSGPSWVILEEIYNTL